MHKTKTAVIYWGGVGIILVLALIARFNMPSLPFVQPDSWGYLYPAWHAATQGEFVHYLARGFAYPLFLHGCINGLGSFSAVVYVQHLLGVIGLLLLGIGWFRLKEMFALNFLGSVIHVLSGWAMLLLLGFNQFQLHHEHYIGHEALFMFLSALLFYLWVSLFYSFKDAGEKLNTRTKIISLAIIWLNFLIYIILPKWGFALPLNIGLLFLCLWNYAQKFKPALLVLVVGFLIAFMSLLLPEKVLAKKYDPYAGLFASQVIFLFHADLAAEAIKQDYLEGKGPAGVDNDLLKQLHQEIESVLQAGVEGESKPGGYSYNPDDVLYGPAEKVLQQYFAGNPEGYSALCKHYIGRIFKEQKAAYMSKVFGQLGMYYRLDAQRHPRQLKERWATGDYLYSLNLETLQGVNTQLMQWPQGKKYLAAMKHELDLGRSEDSVYGRFHFRNMEPVYRLLDKLYPFSLAVSFLLLLFMLSKISLPLSLMPLCSLFLLVLVYGASLGINLTVSLVHSLEFERYRLFQYCWTLLAQIGVVSVLLSSMLSSKSLLSRIGPSHKEILDLAEKEASAAGSKIFTPMERGRGVHLLHLIAVGLFAIPVMIARLIFRGKS